VSLTTVAAPAARSGGRYWPVLPPAVALAAVGAGLVLGWHGVDLAAAVHRITLFRQDGFTLWDDTWYGGQWTLDYSIVFAAVGATVTLPVLALGAAALATLAFDRIVTPQYGRQARAGVAVFAIGTAVETAIGQYPYLAGEAFALVAIWAAMHRRWPVAWSAALVASLFSPLAGAFVGFAALVWVLADGRTCGRRFALDVAGVAAAALLPVAVTTVLFPGEGQMPFQGIDCAADVAIAAVLYLLAGRRHPVLRLGVALYVVVLVGSFLVHSPVGGNAGRLEDVLALPLAVILLWGRRRVLLLVAVAVPLALSGWGPAWGAVTSIPGQPSAHRAFYTPLVAFLRRVDPRGVQRVEVVPTADHGEAEWVSPSVPVARGWERQTDIADNPIFYRPGALDDATYRAWLLANGVQYVALPDAPLDFAGVREGALVAAGVPGLRLVWHDADWRVWRVAGSGGLATGGAHVVALGAEGVTVAVPRAEQVTIRLRWNPDWRVTAGAGCPAETPSGWTGLRAPRAEHVTLTVRLGGGDSAACAGATTG
jgi:hypothetical protein